MICVRVVCREFAAQTGDNIACNLPNMPFFARFQILLCSNSLATKIIFTRIYQVEFFFLNNWLKSRKIESYYSSNSYYSSTHLRE